MGPLAAVEPGCDGEDLLVLPVGRRVGRQVPRASDERQPTFGLPVEGVDPADGRRGVLYHVRTAVVDRVDLLLVVEQRDRAAVLLDDGPTLGLEVAPVADGNVVVGGHIHTGTCDGTTVV